MQGNLDKGNSQLDAALMALEKTDVGSPKAREVEAAARAALKELLVQRKKLRKARKALRRAEAKARRVKERAAAANVKKARAEKPAAQTPKASKKRPAKKPEKAQAVARPKSAATKPRVTETLPPAEAGSGGEAGGLQESPGASRAGAPHRELDSGWSKTAPGAAP